MLPAEAIQQKAAQSAAPAAPDQSVAAPQPDDQGAPDQSATSDDSALNGEPVRFTKAYSNLQEKLTELADGLGVARSATIPQIEGQEPAEHITAVGQVAAQAGGVTENLMTSSHTGYGKNGGETVLFPAQKLRETVIPAKSEPAKVAIDAARTFVNLAAKLIGDVPEIKTAKSQLDAIGKFQGQGMVLQDLLVALINIPAPVVQAVARAHDRTKENGSHPLRRAAKL